MVCCGREHDPASGNAVALQATGAAMSSFRDQIEACKDKVDRIQTETQKRTALLVHGAVVMDTPVDTSRARSNWTTTLNTVSTVQREADQAAKSNAEIQDIVSRKISIDDTIYITNNVPYIERLNDGYSAQAPAGFVEAAVQIGTERAKEFARAVK